MSSGSSGTTPASPSGSLPSAQSVPTIHKANRRNSDGAVQKGQVIDEATAIAERKAQRDIVVCGPIDNDNEALAKKIQDAASGGLSIKEKPHKKTAGANAMWHFHQLPRVRKGGHTFFDWGSDRAV